MHGREGRGGNPMRRALLFTGLVAVILICVRVQISLLQMQHDARIHQLRASSQDSHLRERQDNENTVPPPPSILTMNEASGSGSGIVLSQIKRLLAEDEILFQNYNKRGDTTKLKGMQLPYTYPVHKAMFSNDLLLSGLVDQAKKDFLTCAAHDVQPLPPSPAAWARHTPRHVNGEQLLDAFFVKKLEGGLFHADDIEKAELKAKKKVWWVPEEGNLPCTEEAQRGIWKLQNPENCDNELFLVTALKEKAHGLGSALSLVVHDLITAVKTKRVLAIPNSKNRWFFAPPECGEFRGWSCYFTPPSHCPVPKVSSSLLKRGSNAKIVHKKDADQKYFSRSDLPNLSTILSDTCEKEVLSWAENPANVYVMGTFQKGTDPMLTWWMAQALRYLLRSPQPWFHKAVSDNTASMGFPFENGLVFQQLRGEVAKFREYYNVFGCHDVKMESYVEWTQLLQEREQDRKIYVSGNTPRAAYEGLVEKQKGLEGVSVLSTWTHPAANVGKESSRWGASSLVVSWTDFWVGVASSGWVCIVQSNWCRMINLLRLTAGRADCPFIDLGLTMMASPSLRKEACIVNPAWPVKPFSSVLEKHRIP